MSLPPLSLSLPPKAFSELFPLFKDASPETLATLHESATFNECPAGRTVLMEDSWGNAVYLIVSGWAKGARSIGEWIRHTRYSWQGGGGGGGGGVNTSVKWLS